MPARQTYLLIAIATSIRAAVLLRDAAHHHTGLSILQNNRKVGVLYMPRKKTKAEDIRNPERYFRKYMADEVKNHYKRQQKIKEHECSLEDQNELGHPAGLIFNTHGEQFEQVGNFLDTIENEQLLAGLKGLSKDQLILVVLQYKEQMTQREIADLLGISQGMVNRRLAVINELLKKYF